MYVPPAAREFFRLEPLSTGLSAPSAFDWTGWAQLILSAGPCEAVVIRRRGQGPDAVLASVRRSEPGGPASRCLDIGPAEELLVWLVPHRAAHQPAPEPALDLLAQALRRAVDEHRQLQQAMETAQDLARRLDWIEQALNFAREVVWEINLRTRAIRYSRFTSLVVAPLGQATQMGSLDNLLQTIHPDDRQSTVDALEAYAQGQAAEFYAEYRQLIRDGQWVWTRSRGLAVELDAQGLPLRIQGTAVGVSRLKQLEEQLRESVANRTQFLATLSHEFRTPLNGIVGATQMALLEDDPSSIQSHLGMVNAASRHLLGLINSVLDYSKLDADALQLDPKPTSLRAVLDELALVFTGGARERGLSLGVECDDAVPMSLKCDALRLTQALSNLVANALRFTHEGSVHVAARQVAVEGPSTRVRFEVRDTGIGMTTEQIDRLFQPYVQADASIARRYGGTGLGLVIARQIVALMGGELGVASELGVGTVFSFEVLLEPVGEMPAAATRADAGLPDLNTSALNTSALNGAKAVSERLAQAFAVARSQLAGRRVMVVDDNRMNLVVIERFLTRAGIICVAVDRASEALSRLQTEAVDLLLMDLYMPEMDGAQAARQLRGNPALQRLPILAVSASVTPQEQALCREAGMDGFVAKPVDPVLLLDALRHHLSAAPELPAS